VLSIENLCISYGNIPVVHNVSLEVADGEIVAIVGESGCGKSTTLQAILGLDSNAEITGGSICFDEKNLTAMKKKELRQVRGLEIAMIFQNAALAMDPMKTIGHLFYESVHVHRAKAKKEECLKSAEALMKKIQLEDTERILKSYPFELSGGMCQRIAIASAMMNQPKLLLADEPTSALDVTAQAEVVRLLKSMRDEMGTSILVVTHNMGVVAQMADKVAVMYGGTVVEYGTAKEIIEKPEHPYTQALLEAIPKMNGDVPQGLGGKPPEFGEERTGCIFCPRCSMAKKKCGEEKPNKRVLSDTHWVYCQQITGV